MGYTHYWEFKSNPKDIKDGDKKFKKSVALLKKCLKNISVELAGGNGSGKPIFTDTNVCFNGLDDDSHETCYLALDNSDFEFDFCKTARKPYDVAVCLTLLCFKKFFEDDFNYSSDGDLDDEGWALATEIFEKIK
jgi:hypothetical protein